MSATDTIAPGSETLEGTPPRRSRRRLLVSLVVVLALAASGAGYLLLTGSDEPADEPVAAGPVEEGAVVEVATVTTNLAGSGDRYARVGIALVLSVDADPVVVASRFALVKDATISEIGRHDAAALQQPDGVGALRRGLGERITELYPDGDVLRVVLTDLLVQ